MRAGRALLWAAILVLSGMANFALGSDVVAQPTTETEKERHEREIERLKHETELTKERASLEKATSDRIKALGIPSYEGKATLDENAGQLEAAMLSTRAVSRIADIIATRLADRTATPADVLPDRSGELDECGLPRDPTKLDSAPTPEQSAGSAARFLVLAADESFDFGVVDFVRGQLVSICSRFLDDLPATERTHLFQMSGRQDLISDLAIPVQVATAIFGALRSNVDVTSVSTAGITHQLLARTVAGRLGRQAILGSQPVIAPATRVVARDSIEGLFSQLYQIRRRAEVHRDSPALAGDANKPRRDRISALINRFDTFAATISTPDAQGNLMIARAARLERLMAPDRAGVRPYIMRVHVDQSGGTVLNTTNLATFLGADPVRVSGGLVASYTVTHPETGQVLSAGAFACRTALTRLRSVHDGTWTRARRRQQQPAVCSPNS